MRFITIVVIVISCLFISAHPAAAQNVPWFRIGLALDQPEIRLTLDGAEMLVDFSESLPKPMFLSGDQLVVNISGGILFVNNVPIGKGPVVLVPGPGLLSWNSRTFRGEFVVMANNNKLSLINRLPLDDYLRGVLPKEVSPVWPMASLKAQAITARTYTLASMNRHGYYDLCTSTHCQVYGGAMSEQASTDLAVAETAGKVMTYKGKTISAYYFSAAGGQTSDVANIWGSPAPYLKAVTDWDQNSPWNQWIKTYNWTDLQALASTAYPQIGRVYRIVPVSFFSDQKLQKITLKGDTGEITITGEQFRFLLGLPSSKILQLGVVYGPDPSVALWWVHNSAQPEAVLSPTDIPGLPSELLNPPWDLADPWSWLQDKDPCKIIARGSGWGHGVGLSQWGAKGMAEAGYDEAQILKHYFPGTELTDVKDLK